MRVLNSFNVFYVAWKVIWKILCYLRIVKLYNNNWNGVFFEIGISNVNNYKLDYICILFIVDIVIHL